MWTRHFQRMAEGKLKPNHKGQYVVEKIQMGGTMKEPTINFVTPVAQAVELAKSELKEVYKGNDVARKQQKSTVKRKTNQSKKDTKKKKPSNIDQLS